MKKFICCTLFLALTACMVFRIAEIVLPKSENRYFILDQYLQEHDTDYDVQVFGSCHSYSSFDPMYLEQKTGIPAFIYANPGEIIPTIYVRMAQMFRQHTPKVAVLDIWGINPYETYDSTSRILEFYMPPNIESLHDSEEKQEVIEDFDALNPLHSNYPFFKYKDRLLDGSITKVDFQYKFEDTQPYAAEYIFKEMTQRLANHGFRVNPAVKLEDYSTRQKSVPHFHFQQIEPVIVKYLQKIFDLCKENGVIFLDTEQELVFDYTVDFYDYQHLSQTGARKVTDFLTPYIRQALNSEAPNP